MATQEELATRATYRAKRDKAYSKENKAKLDAACAMLAALEELLPAYHSMRDAYHHDMHKGAAPTNDIEIKVRAVIAQARAAGITAF